MNPRLFNLLVSELRRRPAEVDHLARLIKSAARPGPADARGAPPPRVAAR